MRIQCTLEPYSTPPCASTRSNPHASTQGSCWARSASRLEGRLPRLKLCTDTAGGATGIGCTWDQHSKRDRQYVGHRLGGYRAGGRGGGAGGAGQTQARAHSAKRRDSHSFRPHRPTNTRASCLHPRQSVAASASPAAEAALPDGASVSPGADAAWPAGRGRASGSRRQCPRRGSRAAGSAIGMLGAPWRWMG